MSPVLTLVPESSVRPKVATILVTGASGLLGSALCRVLAQARHRIYRHGRTTSADATDRCFAFPLEQIELIEPAVRRCEPDWIIHAAGNTNVDRCELAPEDTRRVHVEASAELARAASRHGSRLLYVSTDSVYDGDCSGSHEEDAESRPINWYARTKRDGEVACLNALKTTLVARLNFFGLHATRQQGLASWVLNNLKAGRCFGGFTDVLFNPLFSFDLAALIEQAISRDLPGGIYNFGAADSCSKFDFARRLALLVGADTLLVQPVPLAEAGLATPRPRNTVMSTRKLAGALGQSMPTIDECLSRLIDTRSPENR